MKLTRCVILSFLFLLFCPISVKAAEKQPELSHLEPVLEENYYGPGNSTKEALENDRPLSGNGGTSSGGGGWFPSGVHRERPLIIQ